MEPRFYQCNKCHSVQQLGASGKCVDCGQYDLFEISDFNVCTYIEILRKRISKLEKENNGLRKSMKKNCGTCHFMTHEKRLGIIGLGCNHENADMEKGMKCECEHWKES